MSSMRRRLLSAGAGLFALALAGCNNGPRFNTLDIADGGIGGDFQLTDQRGQARTLADFRGKVVVLFFGYTSCPDVCPTGLAVLRDVLAQLGPKAAGRVQVLFISVDPQRDTPAQLAGYMDAFDPGFLGLTGTPEQIARAAKSFKVIYKVQDDVSSGRYTVDHTAGSFILDPQGRVRLFARYGETAERIAADLRVLLAGQ